MDNKKMKIAIVGASMRAYSMFADPFYSDELRDFVEVVGIYDTNTTRAQELSKNHGNWPVFGSFDEMIKVGKPDTVLVVTVDAFHHEYIIRALEAGCDAITEKPMTIDAEKVRAIIDAEKRTGKKVTVTFNYRFIPYVTRIKEIVKSGAIGKVLSVDFEWLLDSNMQLSGHGTSYFRRWNRYLSKSGGLLVHKSTHHFDLINWWIDDEPEMVYAFGQRSMYGNDRLEGHGEYCRDCKVTDKCKYFYDVKKNEFETRLFVNAEHEDGYHKDSCVFKNDITCYDTMAVSVQYKNKALLSYSLNAHTPYEGWRMAINGSEGRLEAGIVETGMLSKQDMLDIKVFDSSARIITHTIEQDRTGHGGGDVRLRRMLFVGDLPDPLGHQAGSRAGAMSVLIGAAGNIAIAEKRPVLIEELLKG